MIKSYELKLFILLGLPKRSPYGTGFSWFFRRYLIRMRMMTREEFFLTVTPVYVIFCCTRPPRQKSICDPLLSQEEWGNEELVIPGLRKMIRIRDDLGEGAKFL